MRGRDGCAVVITASPDTRFFGSMCFETGDVTTVPQLCRVMIDHLKGMADYQYYFIVYPGDHLTLKVIGAVGEEPEPEDVVRYFELFSDFVEQFNWHDIRQDWVRFRLCQVHLLTPRFAAHMRFRQPVTVMPLGHLCRYPGL